MQFCKLISFKLTAFEINYNYKINYAVVYKHTYSIL